MDMKEKLILLDEMKRLKFWYWNLQTNELQSILKLINDRIEEIDRILLEDAMK